MRSRRLERTSRRVTDELERQIMPIALVEYAKTLPEIYRDVLSTFPAVEPSRKAGYGLAFQTIFEALKQKRSLGEIIAACEKMQVAGVVEIMHRMFVHPTLLGEEIISAVTGKEAQPDIVPEFPVPPEH